MTKKWYFIVLISAICTLCLIWYFIISFAQQKTIKVGILHSLTGDLAISERPVAEATLLAIKEINATGGILGKKIEPLLIDGASDENVFAAQAHYLITQEKVVVIFGCWTSPSRIMVKNIVEQYNSLLFYPVQFEGLENSHNVVYTSSNPNQQVIPGVTWCLQHLGTKFFLVGSDLIMHAIIKDIVYAYGGKIVGEEYLALKNKNVNHIVEKIIATQPDVILNNIEGESNLIFFNELRKQKITPEKIPSMSFSVSEPELREFNIDSMTGDYATWNYFESIDSIENKNFVKKIKEAFGKDHPVDDAMEAAYYGVYLWKQAVEKAQSTNTDLVRISLYNQAFNAPQGIIHVAENSLQMWQFTRVGKIRSDKKFTILWSSKKAIQPMAYPPTRTKEEWDIARTKLIEEEKKNDKKNS
ncbi:MAG TPA: urea ABC transporter substrate-binding protein [Candidatus Babeliales bacterium]|nr:urea ABC transporter substrate-binding protein [Candidatus Babeliales bacterium]